MTRDEFETTLRTLDCNRITYNKHIKWLSMDIELVVFVEEPRYNVDTHLWVPTGNTAFVTLIKEDELTQEQLKNVLRIFNVGDNDMVAATLQNEFDAVYSRMLIDIT